MESGQVRTPADLYRLETSTLAQMERMGETSAAKLINAIDRSRSTTLQRFLYGLGIINVGEATAAALANHFGNLPGTGKRLGRGAAEGSRMSDR